MSLFNLSEIDKDQEVMRHWVLVEHDWEGDLFACGKCGAEVVYMATGTEPTWDFCPVCGKDLRVKHSTKDKNRERYNRCKYER